MANVINGTSTGSGGLISSGDDSGILNIQTNETTAMSIDASQSVDFTNNIDAPNTFGFENRIINGNMVIDQRNAGAASTAPAAGSGYLVDRWRYAATAVSKFTVQQNQGSVTPPTGFTNYLGFTSSAATVVAATDYYLFGQPIEGFNTADLGWGAAGASTITLSFWVRSSLTGTFGGALQNNNGNRSYPFTYTISAANTWEQKSVTIAGDTSGTWVGATNSIGIYVWFGLGVGSTYSGTAGAWATSSVYSATGATSVASTNGATFYITGVQLEKGTQATSFDFRDYGRELILCQRYFWKTNQTSLTQSGCLNGVFRTSTIVTGYTQFPVTMRTAPSVTRGATNDTFYVSGLSATASYSSLTPSFSPDMMWAEWIILSGTTSMNAAYNGQQSFSAEL